MAGQIVENGNSGDVRHSVTLHDRNKGRPALRWTQVAQISNCGRLTSSERQKWRFYRNEYRDGMWAHT